MVQCDGVDNRRAKSDAVPTLLERKRRDMEVKVVMTGTTVQGHDTRTVTAYKLDRPTVVGRLRRESTWVVL